jgi:hypothetical protein
MQYWDEPKRDEQKLLDRTTLLSCLTGGAVWLFLCSRPSTVALIVAGLVLCYLFLGYCLLAVWLPEPQTAPEQPHFVPIPPSETQRPKALTI